MRLKLNLFVVALLPSSRPARANNSDPVHTERTYLHPGACVLMNSTTVLFVTPGLVPVPVVVQEMVSRWLVSSGDHAGRGIARVGGG